MHAQRRREGLDQCWYALAGEIAIRSCKGAVWFAPALEEEDEGLTEEVLDVHACSSGVGSLQRSPDGLISNSIMIAVLFSGTGIETGVGAGNPKLHHRLQQV